ncbi:MAG: SPOR domain-containing protein [Rectinemataceae bacterium]|nr:SPOR domain-containing protein [Rectinemataceae bacterium]
MKRVGSMGRMGSEMRAILVALCLFLCLMPMASVRGRPLLAQTTTVRKTPVQTQPVMPKTSTTIQASAESLPFSKELVAARKELLVLEPGKTYVSRLETLANKLAPSEALALLIEFSPKSPASSMQSLWFKAASYALLLGRFMEAASCFESAAGSGTSEKEIALLLRAARCRIAAGDTIRARELAVECRTRSETAFRKEKDAKTSGSKSSSAPAPKPDSLPDPVLLRPTRIRADLIEAWSWLVEGDTDRSLDRARRLINNPETFAARGTAERREALFIIWNSSSGKEKSDVAAWLADEYPDSPEAGMVREKFKSPPLAHWLLGINPASLQAASSGISAGTPAGGPPSIQNPSSSPGAPVSVPATAQDGSAPERLQVGYFSREENAKQLRQELASKGFSAWVEPRQTPGGPARWAVTVDIPVFSDAGSGGGKATGNLQATQLRLKDLGYESYPVE